MVERRKIEWMNQFMLLYIYIWKSHNETPCLAMLNKQKYFKKMENRKIKQILSEGWYLQVGGVYKERV
jgi:hypothetical protein